MTTTKAKRGFAAMTPEQRQSIAAAGGRAAHAKGTAYEFDTEAASAAGKKGAAVALENRRRRQQAGEDQEGNVK